MKHTFCLTILLFSAGCSLAHSVAYYKSDADERRETVDRCVSAGIDTLDCRNAKQAAFDITRQNASDAVAVAPSAPTPGR